ncbi:hypothetical protein [Paenibacillus sp. NPDC058071]|uniref:hypothetical protein n=1 Tax=Paenibacillus sp. NPDC058071 TaxID=3346326 RepID=UPI0036D920A5
MKVIENEHFNNETIGFDGFHFIGCTFTNCVLLIETLEFNFTNCSFYDSVLHVNPELPIFEISHRLSQSAYDRSTTCVHDDYKYPQTTLQLPNTILN